MMTSLWIPLIVMAATAQPEAGGRSADEPTTTEQRAPEGDWTVKRVDADPDRQPKQLDDGTWRLGEFVVEAPLPEGYPAPTPPGMIELKKYPSVRRAEVSGQGSSRTASWRAFNPLFRHIQSHDIAMTAPVEMDLPGWSGEDEPKAWTMSFLYRTPELNDTGKEGPVVVRDTDPVTVLSIGTRGAYDAEAMRDELATLERWLDESQEWEAAGPPRWFGYNGPSVPMSRKWGEVQIPVRAATAEGEADDASQPANDDQVTSGDAEGVDAEKR